MDLRREDEGALPVIRLAEPAEIDVDMSARFKKELLDLLREEDRQVVFDAAHVEFFDSAGMGALLSVQKRLKQRRGELVLAGLNQSVLEVFRMIGFDMVFRTYADVDGAIHDLAK